MVPMQDGTCPAESTTSTACPIKHDEKSENKEKHS